METYWIRHIRLPVKAAEADKIFMKLRILTK
jgi:hypothetical protein